MSDCIEFAFALAREGAERLTGTAEVARALEDPEPAWVHLAYDHPDTAGWVEQNLGYLPASVRSALLAGETRPRATVVGDGALVILRGVNTNPGQEPEDMVAVRLWVEDGRVISVGRRPLASLRLLADRVGAGNGPRRSGALLSELIEELNVRIDDYLIQLDDSGDALEEAVLRDADRKLRVTLTDIRGELVDVRRFLVPQREAVAYLSRCNAAVLRDEDPLRLAEAHERLIRAVEEAESLRDRMVVVSDELNTALSDGVNRNLYILSLVSAIFLPLGTLTGLMGVNLAGMPGASWEPAFWVFSAILLVIVALLVLILRLMRWF
ncbi:zinc transporter ZntB [Pelagovum pacificum]|uniref:Zinc transporter ZntB n=1 Tax=Pelagovum pacificum TaxID=2588711 RepID=A0A5C5GC82_9RHOB|nr:zinc transporter ZntB [Pelagovum pacificum]QQA44480.1 zinc transporter ZntB [Pelagovum pacificum]TNY32405.1 zinc transporter ZntB [Pelagovum pacificum]